MSIRDLINLSCLLKIMPLEISKC